MTDPTFAHLHVASAYSLRYGASTPAQLVHRAAAMGQRMLALTDRDGLYGAVRFVRAASEAGLSPVVGVDLALATERGGGAASSAGSGRARRHTSATAPRPPVRGGALVDDRAPRVVVLARGREAGVADGAGWAALCRLVTAAHLPDDGSGKRGRPRITSARLSQACLPEAADEPSPLLVLVGPDSDVGRVICHDPTRAAALLRTWKTLLGAALVVEVACLDAPPGRVHSAAQARRLWRLARDERVPCVLTGGVRHADPQGAVTIDVLDAARRLTLLEDRHLDRVSTDGHLTSTAHMSRVAERITGDPGDARALMSFTAIVAAECVQDPRRDIGLGSIHLPEPDVLGLAPDGDPQHVLTDRCRSAVTGRYPDAHGTDLAHILDRLDDELAVIASLGYATYFLTVAVVCDLIRDAGVRVAARGSGAGSLVTHLLGISGVDPIRHHLLMERFCSPLRAQLPDIDVDVESARRTETYERILDHFGGERVTCVSMMETYRVRHAIRDVGSALGLPAVEVDAIAKAFPHVRARDTRNAVAELPELASMGLTAPRMEVLFDLVERLDGLPRHIALHPCGVVLSGLGLLDRTPVEASRLGFPMSQFDKDDVEALGLLKLDVLGIRMQSAMAYAVDEIERVEGIRVDLDDRTCLPLDDEPTFELIRSTRTLGCFQIESPGQRELIGKFAPETFEDIIIDISLFRPGPVKSDMITPFLAARQGWAEPDFLHPSLEPALAETWGVVVFHEQLLRIVSITTGVSLAEADEVRRALGTTQGQERVRMWWHEKATERGYAAPERDRIWEVLAAFASFGFCKAHAAAFALPTFQSAWLKTHHTAAFLAGVLTHDPGMYPKRLILDDARTHGIPVLGLDVNASGAGYRVESVPDPLTPSDTAETFRATARVEEPPVRGGTEKRWAPGGASVRETVGRDIVGGEELDGREGVCASSRVVASCIAGTDSGSPTTAAHAVRLGIRVGLADVKGISGEETARIVAGQPYAGLEDLARRARPSRPVLERLVMAGAFDEIYGIGAGPGSGLGRRGAVTRRDLLLHVAELDRWSRAGVRGCGRRPEAPCIVGGAGTGPGSGDDVRRRAAAQSRGAAPVVGEEDRSVQLALDVGPELTPAVGLPELDAAERVRAELDVLGLDVSAHVLEPYEEMLADLGIVRARDLRGTRSRSEILVAGVKVATQTPPVRSGRRVIFVTLDDATGPVDATFFEDVQGPYAMTLFHRWLLLVRGVTRRTGPRGVSIRATSVHDLTAVWEAWTEGGARAAHAAMTPRTVTTDDALAPLGHRRVLRHPSGFRQSPYTDVMPAGTPARSGHGLGAAATTAPSRTPWHSGPGSAGR